MANERSKVAGASARRDGGQAGRIYAGLAAGAAPVVPRFVPASPETASAARTSPRWAALQERSIHARSNRLDADDPLHGACRADPCPHTASFSHSRLCAETPMTQARVSIRIVVLQGGNMTIGHSRGLVGGIALMLAA